MVASIDASDLAAKVMLLMATVKTPAAAARPSRRDRADATRLRVVKSAYDLFCERGYAGTMLADVAQRAGVAVATVRFIFHTKAELLSRVFDFAVMGEEPLPPEEQEWYVQMAAEPDLVPALHHLVAGEGAINIRATPLNTSVRATAESDPDTARVWAFHEQLRAGAHRAILEILVAKSALRDGLTPEKATHLLLFYLGSDAYRPLVLDLGWTHEEWVDWAVATIALELFATDSE
jgi:AcrR family transcriptional regulator